MDIEFGTAKGAANLASIMSLAFGARVFVGADDLLISSIPPIDGGGALQGDRLGR